MPIFVGALGMSLNGLRKKGLRTEIPKRILNYPKQLEYKVMKSSISQNLTKWPIKILEEIHSW